MMSEELEDEFYKGGDAEEGRAQSRNQDSLDNQHQNGEVEEAFNMNLAIDDSMNKNNEGEEENLKHPRPQPRTNQELVEGLRAANPKQKFPEAWSEFLPDRWFAFVYNFATSHTPRHDGAKQGPEKHHQRGPGALAVRYGRWLVVLSGVCRVLERPKKNFLSGKMTVL